MDAKITSVLNENITIFDVAERAGVSYGTVSRVINNAPHVKPLTRQRVQAAMEELGYVANRQARILAGGRSNIIGVLVPDLGTGYIGEIMRGIDAEVSLSQLDLMLYTTHRQEAKEANFVVTLTRGGVDGLLLVLPRNPANYLGKLQEHGVPYVLIDHQGIDSTGPAVGATNWQGAFNATEYLIQLGHEHIGFIAGSMDLGCSQERLAGYQAALRVHHLQGREELVYQGDFFQPSGYAGAQKLLALPTPPTAIFASNDVMAMGVMEAVRDQGLRIPQDISILGFDNVPQATQVTPALTTVQQPLEQMGRMATQILLDRLKNPGAAARRIELPTELIVRASTSVPKDRAG